MSQSNSSGLYLDQTNKYFSKKKRIKEFAHVIDKKCSVMDICLSSITTLFPHDSSESVNRNAWIMSHGLISYAEVFITTCAFRNLTAFS